jgi:hypothetical protein
MGLADGRYSPFLDFIGQFLVRPVCDGPPTFLGVFQADRHYLAVLLGAVSGGGTRTGGIRQKFEYCLFELRQLVGVPTVFNLLEQRLETQPLQPPMLGSQIVEIQFCGCHAVRVVFKVQY